MGDLSERFQTVTVGIQYDEIGEPQLTGLQDKLTGVTDLLQLMENNTEFEAFLEPLTRGIAAAREMQTAVSDIFRDFTDSGKSVEVLEQWRDTIFDISTAADAMSQRFRNISEQGTKASQVEQRQMINAANVYSNTARDSAARVDAQRRAYFEADLQGIDVSRLRQIAQPSAQVMQRILQRGQVDRGSLDTAVSALSHDADWQKYLTTALGASSKLNQQQIEQATRAAILQNGVAWNAEHERHTRINAIDSNMGALAHVPEAFRETFQKPGFTSAQGVGHIGDGKFSQSLYDSLLDMATRQSNPNKVAMDILTKSGAIKLGNNGEIMKATSVPMKLASTMASMGMEELYKYLAGDPRYFIDIKNPEDLLRGANKNSKRLLAAKEFMSVMASAVGDEGLVDENGKLRFDIGRSEMTGKPYTESGAVQYEAYMKDGKQMRLTGVGNIPTFVVPNIQMDAHGRLQYSDPGWRKTNGVQEQDEDLFVTQGYSPMMKILGYDTTSHDTFGDGIDTKTGRAAYKAPRMVKLNVAGAMIHDEENNMVTGLNQSLGEAAARYINEGFTYGQGSDRADYTFGWIKNGAANFVRRDVMQKAIEEAASLGLEDPFEGFNVRGVINKDSLSKSIKQTNNVSLLATPGLSLSDFTGGTHWSAVRLGKVVDDNYDVGHSALLNQDLMYGLLSGLEHYDSKKLSNWIDSASFFMPDATPMEGQMRGPITKFAGQIFDWKTAIKDALTGPNYEKFTSSPFFSNENGRWQFWAPTIAATEKINEAAISAGYGTKDKGVSTADFFKFANSEQGRALFTDAAFRRDYMTDVLGDDVYQLVLESSVKNSDQFSRMSAEKYITMFGKTAYDKLDKDRISKGKDDEGKDYEIVKLTGREAQRYYNQAQAYLGGIYLAHSDEDFETSRDDVVESLATSLNLPVSAYSEGARKTLNKLAQLSTAAGQRSFLEGRNGGNDYYAQKSRANSDYIYESEAQAIIQEQRNALSRSLTRASIRVGEGAVQDRIAKVLPSSIMKLFGINAEDMIESVRPLFELDEALVPGYEEFEKIITSRIPAAAGENEIITMPSKQDMQKAYNILRGRYTGGRENEKGFYASTNLLDRFNTGDYDGDTIWTIAAKSLGNPTEISSRMMATQASIDAARRRMEKERGALAEPEDPKAIASFAFTNGQAKLGDKGQIAVGSILARMKSQAQLGLGSKILRDAFQLDDEDENKWAAIAQAIDFYDRATSEMQKKGMLSQFTEAEFNKVAQIGNVFQRGFSFIDSFIGDKTGKVKATKDMIFKTNLPSMNSSAGVAALLTSIASQRGKTHSRVADVEDYLYAAGFDFDTAEGKTARFYGDLLADVSSGIKLVGKSDLDTLDAYIGQWRTELLKRTDTDSEDYRGQERRLKQMVKRRKFLGKKGAPTSDELARRVEDADFDLDFVEKVMKARDPEKYAEYAEAYDAVLGDNAKRDAREMSERERELGEKYFEGRAKLADAQRAEWDKQNPYWLLYRNAREKKTLAQRVLDAQRSNRETGITSADQQFRETYRATWDKVRAEQRRLETTGAMTSDEMYNLINPNMTFFGLRPWMERLSGKDENADKLFGKDGTLAGYLKGSITGFDMSSKDSFGQDMLYESALPSFSASEISDERFLKTVEDELAGNFTETERSLMKKITNSVLTSYGRNAMMAVEQTSQDVMDSFDNTVLRGTMQKGEEISGSEKRVMFRDVLKELGYTYDETQHRFIRNGQEGDQLATNKMQDLYNKIFESDWAGTGTIYKFLERVKASGKIVEAHGLYNTTDAKTVEDNSASYAAVPFYDSVLEQDNKGGSQTFGFKIKPTMVTRDDKGRYHMFDYGFGKGDEAASIYRQLMYVAASKFARGEAGVGAFVDDNGESLIDSIESFDLTTGLGHNINLANNQSAKQALDLAVKALQASGRSKIETFERARLALTEHRLDSGDSDVDNIVWQAARNIVKQRQDATAKDVIENAGLSGVVVPRGDSQDVKLRNGEVIVAGQKYSIRDEAQRMAMEFAFTQYRGTKDTADEISSDLGKYTRERLDTRAGISNLGMLLARARDNALTADEMKQLAAGYAIAASEAGKTNDYLRLFDEVGDTSDFLIKQIENEMIEGVGFRQGKIERQLDHIDTGIAAPKIFSSVDRIFGLARQAQLEYEALSSDSKFGLIYDKDKDSDKRTTRDVAYLIRPESVVLGADGKPVIDEKTGRQKTTPAEYAKTQMWIGDALAEGENVTTPEGLPVVTLSAAHSAALTAKANSERLDAKAAALAAREMKEYTRYVSGIVDYANDEGGAGIGARGLERYVALSKYKNELSAAKTEAQDRLNQITVGGVPQKGRENEAASWTSISTMLDAPMQSLDKAIGEYTAEQLTSVKDSLMSRIENGIMSRKEFENIDEATRTALGITEDDNKIIQANLRANEQQSGYLDALHSLSKMTGSAEYKKLYESVAEPIMEKRSAALIDAMVQDGWITADQGEKAKTQFTAANTANKQMRSYIDQSRAVGESYTISQQNKSAKEAFNVDKLQGSATGEKQFSKLPTVNDIVDSYVNAVQSRLAKVVAECKSIIETSGSDSVAGKAALERMRVAIEDATVAMSDASIAGLKTKAKNTQGSRVLEQISKEFNNEYINGLNAAKNTDALVRQRERELDRMGLPPEYVDFIKKDKMEWDYRRLGYSTYHGMYNARKRMNTPFAGAMSENDVWLNAFDSIKEIQELARTRREQLMTDFDKLPESRKADILNRVAEVNTRESSMVEQARTRAKSKYALELYETTGRGAFGISYEDALREAGFAEQRRAIKNVRDTIASNDFKDKFENQDDYDEYVRTAGEALSQMENDSVLRESYAAKNVVNAGRAVMSRQASAQDFFERYGIEGRNYGSFIANDAAGSSARRAKSMDIYSKQLENIQKIMTSPAVVSDGEVLASYRTLLADMEANASKYIDKIDEELLKEETAQSQINAKKIAQSMAHTQADKLTTAKEVERAELTTKLDKISSKDEAGNRTAKQGYEEEFNAVNSKLSSLDTTYASEAERIKDNNEYRLELQRISNDYAMQNIGLAANRFNEQYGLLSSARMMIGRSSRLGYGMMMVNSARRQAEGQYEQYSLQSKQNAEQGVAAEEYAKRLLATNATGPMRSLSNYVKMSNKDFAAASVNLTDEQRKAIETVRQNKESQKLIDAQQKQAKQNLKFNSGFLGFGKGIGLTATSLISGYVSRLMMSAFKDAFNEIKQFSTEMAQIQGITLKSDGEMESVRASAIANAKKYKTSISAVSQAEAALYRQGLSDEEVSARLGPTMQLSKVAGIDSKTSNEVITMMLKSGLYSSAQSAADAIAALGDAAATTAGELTKALKKTAPVASQVGMSGGQLTALLTAMLENSQLSGNIIGTGVATMLSRINKLGPTDEIKIDESGNAYSTADVSNVLHSVGVDTYTVDENGEVHARGISSVLGDVASRWDDMSDTDKQRLASALGGQGRNNTNFYNAMESLSKDNGAYYESLQQVEANSLGATAKKYEIMTGDLATSIQEVKTQWQSIWADPAAAETLSGLLNIFKDIISGIGDTGNALEGLIDTILPVLTVMSLVSGNWIGTAIGGVASFFATKGFGLWADNDEEPDESKLTSMRYAEARIGNIQSVQDKIANTQELDFADKYYTEMTEDEKSRAVSAIAEVAPYLDDATGSLNSFTSGLVTLSDVLEDAAVNTKQVARNEYERLINETKADAANRLNEEGAEILNEGLVGWKYVPFQGKDLKTNEWITQYALKDNFIEDFTGNQTYSTYLANVGEYGARFEHENADLKGDRLFGLFGKGGKYNGAAIVKGEKGVDKIDKAIAEGQTGVSLTTLTSNTKLLVSGTTLTTARPNNQTYAFTNSEGYLIPATKNNYLRVVANPGYDNEEDKYYRFSHLNEDEIPSDVMEVINAYNTLVDIWKQTKPDEEFIFDTDDVQKNIAAQTFFNNEKITGSVDALASKYSVNRDLATAFLTDLYINDPQKLLDVLAFDTDVYGDLFAYSKANNYGAQGIKYKYDSGDGLVWSPTKDFSGQIYDNAGNLLSDDKANEIRESINLADVKTNQDVNAYKSLTDIAEAVDEDALGLPTASLALLRAVRKSSNWAELNQNIGVDKWRIEDLANNDSKLSAMMNSVEANDGLYTFAQLRDYIAELNGFSDINGLLSDVRSRESDAFTIQRTLDAINNGNVGSDARQTIMSALDISYDAYNKNKTYYNDEYKKYVEEQRAAFSSSIIRDINSYETQAERDKQKKKYQSAGIVFTTGETGELLYADYSPWLTGDYSQYFSDYAQTSEAAQEELALFNAIRSGQYDNSMLSESFKSKYGALSSILNKPQYSNPDVLNAMADYAQYGYVSSSGADTLLSTFLPNLTNGTYNLETVEGRESMLAYMQAQQAENPEVYSMLDNIFNLSELMPEIAAGTDKATEAMDDFLDDMTMKSLVEAFGDDMEDYADLLDLVSDNAKKAANAQKKINQTFSDVGGNQYYRNKFLNGNKDDETIKGLSGVLGMSESMFKGLSDAEQIRQVEQSIAADAAVLDESLTTTLNGMKDEMQATIDANSITLDGVEIDISQGPVSFSDILSYVPNEVRGELSGLLAQLEAIGGSATIQSKKVGDTWLFDVVTSLTGAGGTAPKGGGGGGKSASAKLIEKLKRLITASSHQVKMIQAQETKYEQRGELGNYANMIRLENDAQAKYAEQLRENIEELKKQMAKTKKNSDDWYDLRDAIFEAEEAIEEVNNTIEANNKKLEENQQAIYKTRTDLEDSLKQLIDEEKSKQRSMLEGTVSMQETILDVIKQRYQEEWD